MKRSQIMTKASLNSICLAVFYAAMGVYLFQQSPISGLFGALLSTIFFRDFQVMRNLAKQMKEEESNEKDHK